MRSRRLMDMTEDELLAETRRVLYEVAQRAEEAAGRGRLLPPEFVRQVRRIGEQMARLPGGDLPGEHS